MKEEIRLLRQKTHLQFRLRRSNAPAAGFPAPYGWRWHLQSSAHWLTPSSGLRFGTRPAMAWAGYFI